MGENKVVALPFCSQIALRFYPYRLAKGDFRTVEVYSSPIKQNGVLILFSIIHDITDRKRMEEERLEMERKVLHAQKLESLGVMAGGIAHDFNNQLAVVLGNLELALTDETLNPDARHSIKSAVEAAKRSAELSHQMMIYWGGSLDFPVPVDIKELLNKNSGLLQLGVSKHVKLNLEINATLPRIKGDPDQIQRLVMNILLTPQSRLEIRKGMSLLEQASWIAMRLIWV